MTKIPVGKLNTMIYNHIFIFHLLSLFLNVLNIAPSTL